MAINFIKKGIDTSDANATASDIAWGKTAYVNGKKITGNIYTLGGTSGTTVKANGDVVALPNYNGGAIRAAHSFSDEDWLIRQNGQVNYEISYGKIRNAIGLTGEQIKSGETVLGVEGSAVTDYFVTSVSPDDATIFRYIKRVPMLETANKTDFSSMCSGCISLIEVPLWDTSSATDTSYMLGGTAITSSPQFNTANVTNMQQMFKDCTALTTVPVFNTAKVTNMWDTFDNCPALSNESLNNILEMLTNASAYIEQGTNMTLKWIGLSSTQATTCTTLSNWTACETAGWTTGY